MFKLLIRSTLAHLNKLLLTNRMLKCNINSAVIHLTVRCTLLSFKRLSRVSLALLAGLLACLLVMLLAPLLALQIIIKTTKGIIALLVSDVKNIFL